MPLVTPAPLIHISPVSPWATSLLFLSRIWNFVFRMGLPMGMHFASAGVISADDDHTVVSVGPYTLTKRLNLSFRRLGRKASPPQSATKLSRPVKPQTWSISYVAGVACMTVRLGWGDRGT